MRKYQSNISKYIEENKPEWFVGVVYGSAVVVAVLRFTDQGDNTVYYKIAYTVKADKEEFNWARAKKIAGERLRKEAVEGVFDHAFTVSLDKPGRIKSRRMANLITVGFHQALATQSTGQLPGKMLQRFYRRQNRGDYMVQVEDSKMFFVEDVLIKYHYKARNKLRKVLLTSEMEIYADTKTVTGRIFS